MRHIFFPSTDMYMVTTAHNFLIIIIIIFLNLEVCVIDIVCDMVKYSAKGFF